MPELQKGLNIVSERKNGQNGPFLAILGCFLVFFGGFWPLVEKYMYGTAVIHLFKLQAPHHFEKVLHNYNKFSEQNSLDAILISVVSS